MRENKNIKADKMKKRTQGMNWIRKEKRLAIYMRDGLSCAYCGTSIEDGAQLSLDHIKPYSKGGSNDQKNLVTCCSKCNSVRQDRPWKEFAKKAAGYLNIESKEIIRHVENCRKRKIDTKAAKEIMSRRGSWTNVINNNCK